MSTKCSQCKSEHTLLPIYIKPTRTQIGRRDISHLECLCCGNKVVVGATFAIGEPYSN